MNAQSEFNFDAPPKKNASEVSSDLLERIKKLLRLSESKNPHEAALAMERAMELTDRHNLDISSLDVDEDVAHIIHRWFPLGARVTVEMRFAVSICKTFFNVSSVFEKTRGSTASARVLFVGSDSDIAIADYVFHFLLDSLRRCTKVYEELEQSYHRRMTPNKRANFRAGFFYGVFTQLSNQRETFLLENKKLAIVLSDQKAAREEAMHDLVGDAVKVPLRKHRRNWSAIECGYEHGKNTRINAALGTTGNALLLGN